MAVDAAGDSLDSVEHLPKTIIAFGDVALETVHGVARFVVLLEEPGRRRSLADAAEDRIRQQTSRRNQQRRIGRGAPMQAVQPVPGQRL